MPPYEYDDSHLVLIGLRSRWRRSAATGTVLAHQRRDEIGERLQLLALDQLELAHEVDEVLQRREETHMQRRGYVSARSSAHSELDRRGESARDDSACAVDALLTLKHVFSCRRGGTYARWAKSDQAS
jgi:hypothetical protein